MLQSCNKVLWGRCSQTTFCRSFFLAGVVCCCYCCFVLLFFCSSARSHCLCYYLCGSFISYKCEINVSYLLIIVKSEKGTGAHHTHTQTHTLSQFDCSAQRSSVHLLSTRISAKKIAKPRTFLANMRFASWYFRAYLFNSVYNVHSTLNLYFLGLICEKFILPYRRNIWELVSLAAPYVWRFQLLITRLNAHFLFRLNTHKKSHD